jgi:hypothetical protein
VLEISVILVNFIKVLVELSTGLGPKNVGCVLREGLTITQEIDKLNLTSGIGASSPYWSFY